MSLLFKPFFQHCETNGCHQAVEYFHSRDLAHLFDNLHDQYFHEVNEPLS